MKWQEALSQHAAAHTDHVLVTVLATSGSAPRDAGSKMLITAEHAHDTIGGGQLEQLVTRAARQMLSAKQAGQQIQHYPLAAAAEQCCGGSVTVLLESFVYSLQVAIFGAGFVGREIAGMLHKLDAQAIMYDSRPQIRGLQQDEYVCSDDLCQTLCSLPPANHILIMTHEHELDYQLVQACLEQHRSSVGLIGSVSKWQRFQSRLLRDGASEAALARVRCPLGVPDVKRKDPYAVAVSIVVELLQLEPVLETATLSWRQVKSALVQQTDTNTP